MSETQPPVSQDRLKRDAAIYAVETFIQPGMQVGLGSGSTAEIFVEELARRANTGRFGNLVTVSTSEKVAALAQTFGLKVVGLNEVLQLDVTVDGADEIEPFSFALTKGRGGALLREKLVAAATSQEVIIADESKLVTRLGEKMPVPVEIVAFGWNHIAGRVRALGCDPILRMKDDRPYLTDHGNYILDCQFQPIENPAELAAALKSIIGVVEHGLFVGMTRRIVIAASTGVYEVRPPLT